MVIFASQHKHVSIAWMNRWMDEQTNGWVDGCTDGPTGVGQMDEQTEDGQMINGWKDGKMVGRRDRWKNG